MSATTISGLTGVVSVSGTEVIPADVAPGATRKLTAAQIASLNNAAILAAQGTANTALANAAAAQGDATQALADAATAQGAANAAQANATQALAAAGAAQGTANTALADAAAAQGAANTALADAATAQGDIDAHKLNTLNPHAVTAAQVGAIPVGAKGAANGVAELDAGGKLPAAQLPDAAITDTFVVVDLVSMLALPAERGDFAVRTDIGKTFILRTEPASIFSNWQELLAPGTGVTSVNGNPGPAVVLNAGDVGAVPRTEKGAAGGVAELTAESLVPTAQGGLPPGTILDYAGVTPPDDFLECDGAAVSRTTYARLFAAIGTIWGDGDGSTTFNLPDLRRRTTVGRGGVASGVLGNAVGDTGGSEVHTLTVDEIPAHTHDELVDGAAVYQGTGTNAAITVTATGDAPAEVTGSTGGGSPHNNIQPSAVVYKIIKT